MELMNGLMAENIKVIGKITKWMVMVLFTFIYLIIYKK